MLSVKRKAGFFNKNFINPLTEAFLYFLFNIDEKS